MSKKWSIKVYKMKELEAAQAKGKLRWFKIGPQKGEIFLKFCLF